MSSQDTIHRYVREVERWTPGPIQRQRELATELEGHLRDADAEGHLAETLVEFGSPRDAARSLLAGRSKLPAPRWRRMLGGLVDVASLVGIGALSAPMAFLVGGTGDTVYIDGRNALFLPEFGCRPDPCSTAGDFVFFSFVFAAIFWFVAVITLLEWRYGRSLGKVVARTRVISEDGTAITLGQAVIRRLPFFFAGPLQVVDWSFALFGPERQRGFDRIARTIVVRDTRKEGRAR